MSISLPTFRKEGARYIQVPESTTASKAAKLMAKHSPTITLLREKLGFQKDETVIAWLLDQIEQSTNLDNAIQKLLQD
jgi:ethanolamine utilization cobalamin adenosyltransferase